jgi:hypothetical protein
MELTSRLIEPADREGSHGASMFDPIAEQMLGLIRGYWVSQIVGTLAKLKIPDRLANGALRHDELAKEIGCDSQATYRLLRASANVGVISAMSDGRFGLTLLGEKLRSNVPGSMRDIAIVPKSSHDSSFAFEIAMPLKDANSCAE